MELGQLGKVEPFGAATARGRDRSFATESLSLTGATFEGSHVVSLWGGGGGQLSSGDDNWRARLESSRWCGTVDADDAEEERSVLGPFVVGGEEHCEVQRSVTFDE